MTNTAVKFDNNITHSANFDVDEAVEQIKQRLRESSELTLPLDRSIELLEQLTEFELGRFLIQHRGLNGKWIKHIVLSGDNPANMHPLEEWICTKCPGMLGTAQRYKIFQDIATENLRDGMNLANIPAGEMDILYSLDLKKFKDITLTGIDLDPEILEQARANMGNYQINAEVELKQSDAWKMRETDKFDILMSNGLGIYVPDFDKLRAMYARFYQAIKPGGLLVTSFISLPPRIDPNSTWGGYAEEDIQIQTAMFVDILQASFMNYRSEQTMRDMLQELGFKDLDVINDSFGIYPTITGVK